MGKGQELYKKAKKLIPGGTQLLSKRPEMFLPEQWPAYYEKAKGCEIWDLDGKKYTDTSYMGIGANILGYADEDVNKAVKEAVDKGNMSTLNCPEEVELAERLVKLHPWAGMVRYARTGGEAVAIAVRIARAKTEKDIILFCGYHGWHDWYLSTNLADDKALDGHLIPGLNPLGVPRGLKGTSIPFAYNDPESFLNLVEKHRGKIAAVVMEPIRNFAPSKEFLETIRKTTEKEGIVFIFDEITAAWRQNMGGAHLAFTVRPDIAVFGKAMSNGYPMAAIIGKDDVMDVAQDTFISSTYWTEKIGPAASLATLDKLAKEKVPEHLVKTGFQIQEGWKAMAEKNSLEVNVSGIAPLGHFGFKHKNPLALKTLFVQEMLEQGFLATTGFYVSFAHKQEHVDSYIKAVDKAFASISSALKAGDLEKRLKGPIAHPGFKRLT